MRHFYTFLVAILFTSLGYGQTQIYTLDFDGNGSYTTSSPENIGSTSDYWGVTDGTNINATFSGSTFSGNNFFAAQDFDGLSGLSATESITISGISIANYINLQIRVYIAEDDDGSAQDWDADSQLLINYDIDSNGFQNGIHVQSVGGTNTEPAIDSDYNGAGDSPTITDSWTQYTFNIVQTGNSMDIVITFDGLDAGDEDIAIDDIEIWGDLVGGSSPTVGFDNATSSENETNTTFTSSNIPITVSNYDGNQIDIDVNVTGGTAEVGDYTFTSPTSLSFTADGTQNITIDINDDADFDDETVELTITETSSVTGLVISQATHTVTIIDDEVAPPVTTIALQDFDSGSPEWDYTTDPVENSPACVSGDDVWNVVSSLGNLTVPNSTGNFFGGQDLAGATGCGTSGVGTIDFVSVDVSDFTGVTLSFDYEVDGFNSGADELSYIVTFDSTPEAEVFLCDGCNQQDVEGTVNINIPNGTQTVSLQVRAQFDGGSDYFGVDNFKVEGVFNGLVYSDGVWSPAAPSPATGALDALVLNGTYNVTSNIAINNMVVKPGSNVDIDSGIVVTSNSLTMESTSSSYSSLINNGTIIGTTTYNRYTNVVGTGATGTGGNDLISVPLHPFGGQTFNSFLTLGTPANSTKLASQTIIVTTYAFGPYNNTASVPDYENYDSNSTDVLEVAQGYRAATTTGETLTFTGDALQANQTIMLTNPVAGGSQWNLIGNPFASYVDAQAWLSTNGAFLDPTAIAIYGYNSGTYSGGDQTTGNFTIINGTSNNTLNIAPGQAFFVAADTGDISGNAGTVIFAGNSGFPADMRTTTGSDDFIEGRNSTNHHLKLKLNGTTSETTSFYFNDNSTRGLDPGFDAATLDAFTSEHLLYSHLVEDNTGRSMAINSLSLEDMLDVTIPLGVNSNQGEEITFSIDTSTLPNGIDVYLDDNVANTSTLLNSNDYMVTPSVDLNGTGRFYLRLGDSALSVPTAIFDQIDIFTNRTEKTVVISGELPESSVAHIYDLQGRQVLSTALDTALRTQRINISDLSTGVYVVKVSNNTSSKSQKVILN
ncbi:T9SS type A sorting domain-containing protein [Winogradskyella sp.]|uniref:T9SS type A sorting domain-containing protein n=1 Tax=Winogradskyella sp. TaxID=1883156 RepID=UPI001B145D10|nr:T9SS type A sorting domain-containing protein [Winogradskyella sp.]MBO6881105.1 T9SS type A sorting domain-containing protein [Winogradskyella sp.]